MANEKKQDTTKEAAAKRTNEVLVGLGVNPAQWAKFISSAEVMDEVETALQGVLGGISTAIMMADLKKRGVMIDELSQGAWLVVDLGDDEAAVAVLLRSVSPFQFRVQFGDGEVETVEAGDILRHLDKKFPAPISPDGKNILPKGKKMFLEIETELAEAASKEAEAKAKKEA